MTSPEGFTPEEARGFKAPGDNATDAAQEGQTPSMEDIRKNVADLQARAAETKRLREATAVKGASELEELREKSRQTDGLLNESRTTLTEYDRISTELGQLDPNDEQARSLLRALVGNLETQQQAIDNRVQYLAKNPDVMGKVQDEASKENEAHNREQVLEGIVEQFTPQLDQLAEDVQREIQYGTETLPQQHQEWEAERARLFGEIRDLIAAYNIHPDVPHELPSSFGEDSQLIEQAKAARKQVGWRGGERKQALDALIAREADFRALQKLYADLEQNRLERIRFDSESAPTMYKRFDALRKQAMGAAEAAGADHDRALKVVWKLNEVFKDRLNARINLRDEQGRSLDVTQLGTTYLDKRPEHKKLSKYVHGIYR